MTANAIEFDADRGSALAPSFWAKDCICLGCGAAFIRRPLTAGKWCSRECYINPRRNNRATPKCPVCLTAFKRPHKLGAKPVYCSIGCRRYAEAGRTGKSGFRKKYWNEVIAPRLEVLEKAFEEGLDCKRAGERAGCSTMTAWKCRAKWLAHLSSLVCKCGRPMTHKGPCWWRWQRSDYRRGEVRWPFFVSQPGDEGLELVEAINQTVPSDVPEVLRQEICQELALLLLDGTFQRNELPEAWKTVRSQVLKRYPMVAIFAPLSIESGARTSDFSDDLKVKDRLAVPYGAWGHHCHLVESEQVQS